MPATPGVVRRRTVFVSSKFAGLEDHRHVVIDEILRQGHIPAAMEYFSNALAGSPVDEFLKRQISTSEIFVVIIGAELGQPQGPEALTYVQQEVLEAKRLKLPIVPIMLTEEDHLAARKERVRRRSYVEANERRLDALRKEVCEDNGRPLGRIEFTRHEQAANLYDKFQMALRSVAGSLPDSGGWVDGRLFDQLVSQPTIQGAAANNLFFERFTRRMTQFDTLSGRVQSWKDHKRAAAQFFWATYLPSIVRSRVNRVYLESGSALAFVTEAFITRMEKANAQQERAFSERLTLITNNFISLLELVLTDAPNWRWQDVRLVPPGSISDTYGATVGPILRSVLSVNSPTTDMMKPYFRFLDKDAERALDMCVQQVTEELGSHGLILMTASGIDTRRLMRPRETYRAPTRGERGHTEEELLREKNGNVLERVPFTPFPGPHTGDFLNMMIKRVLLKQDCPRVLFLDEYKWGLDFVPGNCFAVCDRTLPWAEIVKTPMAIVMAARSNQARERMTQELREIGLEVRANSSPVQGATAPEVLIAANDAFEAALPRFQASHRSLDARGPAHTRRRSAR